MTIKTRNRLLLVLLAVSTVLLLTGLFLVIFHYITHTIAKPPAAFLPSNGRVFFLRYSFRAVILSIFTMALYVVISSFFLFIEFEKTQSTEIIYFSMFLVGCLTEIMRLSLPIFNLWDSYSLFFMFCGRIIVTGRVLAPASLLFMAIASGTEQRQNLERNLIIITAASFLTAVIIPLNTATISPLCVVEWGYAKLFFVVRILILCTTALSLLIVNATNGGRKRTAFMFLFLATGYIILCSAQNYLSFTAGAALLLGGSTAFLNQIHKMYLWD